MSETRESGPDSPEALSLLLPLDLSGLKCPLPALRTRKALKGLANGSRLRVICTDPMAGIDIPHLLHETGDLLVSQVVEGNRTIFLIEKRQAGA